VMLGLAVGIDYSLFIISKYRTYALEGYGFKDAAARATGTAGNAVVFAAATVVIALSALTVVQVPFMTTMGLAAAATIAVAAMVAITLVPALLGLSGKYIFGRKARLRVREAQAKGPHESRKVSHKTFWYKWGEAITRRPIVVLVFGVIVITVIALPVRQLTLGLPTDEYAAKSSTERKAYDLLAKGFGAGFNGPLLVVAENMPAITDADRNAIREPAMKQYNEQVVAAMSAQESKFQDEAAMVTTPEQAAELQQEIAAAQAVGQQKQQQAMAQIDQTVDTYAKLVQLKKVADTIAKQDNVEQALPAMATDDGTKGIIQIIPKSAPSDQKTSDLITYLRNSDNQKTLGASLAVTGSTALQNDVNAKLSAALPEYLTVVVGLSLILLMIAFRSIIIPIKATLGFLLSVLAMFGALVAVFEWGWFGIAEAPGPIVSFIPIIAIGILFGLAMDYEFFLVSSMHEAYHYSKDAKKAVVDGFGLGSKVVTAAGVIMVAVFAGFISNHDVTVQAIGFGLAVGILVDAFIVRMTIVPAVMTLLGQAAWWLPKWLDRIIPHVSIEGEEDD
jgi:RND superfamily putative drug exporter